MRRGAAGTCRPSRAVKTFRGIIFLFSKIIHFRFIRKKETYLPVQKFVGSINSYTQCILWTIFYHVVTSLNWYWEVCKRKYCLNGRKFSRTFFGPKTGTFRIGTKKNGYLQNWTILSKTEEKLSISEETKIQTCPNNLYFIRIVWKNRFWRSLGMRRRDITLPRSDAACCQSEKVENIEPKHRSFVLLTQGTYSNDISN